jgi:hypothetical protein
MEARYGENTGSGMGSTLASFSAKCFSITEANCRFIDMHRVMEVFLMYFIIKYI